jgi:hypothetical protein
LAQKQSGLKPPLKSSVFFDVFWYRLTWLRDQMQFTRAGAV